MIIWALVFGMSLTLSGSGKLDAGAQVEAVFRSEKECREVKAKLDQGSKEAAERGILEAQVNSFGSTCVPVVLDIHNKKTQVGS